MCGIAGIVRFDHQPVDRAALIRMRDVLTHRGPDGEGLHVEGPAGLAHRRLSIVDVSTAGAQPMSNETGNVWISFNGEIYNHADIRPGLEARGHRYHSRTDTETIVHLYEEAGDACVEQLHGMFAFAIWDAAKQRLFIARDRLGIKPLYYAVTSTGLVFGSEIKALLASGLVERSFNDAVLPEFLTTRYVPTDETFFKGIRKLMPGHTLTWSSDTGVAIRRYWSLPVRSPKPEVRSRREAARELRGQLERAVSRHLMSDVPLGVFLSGGLDSSALAAMVRNAAGKRISTFSVGFAEAEADELPYARQMAKAIEADHRDVTVTPAQFFEALPQMVWHEDEPIAFPSSIPLYYVAALARDHVKVVLTGEGADELFLGYNRYRVTAWNERLGRPYWGTLPASMRSAIRGTIQALPSRARRIAERTFLGVEPGLRSLFLENFAVHASSDLPQLLRRPGNDSDPYRRQLELLESSDGDTLDRMSRTDLQTYLVELLMKQDQMSMAASIESRVPFLDDQLVEHVVTLPSNLKVRGWQTKAVFRDAVRDLIPTEILERPKMGFPTPVGSWLRGGFSGLVSEFVTSDRALDRGYFDASSLSRVACEHRSGQARNGDRLWLLMNLEIWFRIFIDGDEPAEIADRMSYYANPLGQDERVVAGDNRRASAEPADSVGALPAA